MRRRQVVSHRSVDERGVVIVDGLRCTDPLTTWADLAGTLAVDDLVVMGDTIVELGRDLARRPAECHSRPRPAPRRGAYA